MEKSESYRTPGHLRSVALFFKQEIEKIHNDRKRAWSGLFTAAGYDFPSSVEYC